MKIEKIINTCYAIGAAIVIFGAWKKITHQEGADTFLTIGLLTEVIIFILSAIYEWVTPERKQSSPEQAIQQTNIQDTQISSSMKSLENTLKKIYNIP